MPRFVMSTLAALALSAGVAVAAETTEPPAQDWSFDGIFETFDRGALKRGFQIYSEVCSTCHSLRLVAYRNLRDIGFSEPEVKAIAAEVMLPAGPNEEGETHGEDGMPFMRPGLPSDRFASPFANEQAARAGNSGALPPDLSLMIKAREHGPDYVYAFLTGYQDEAPEGVEMADGRFYNRYFPGNQTSMAPMLGDEAVEYADGTKPTLEQHARDIVTFLSWTAEPEMEERKSLGIKVVLFLVVLTAMLYAVKRKIWSDLH